MFMQYSFNDKIEFIFPFKYKELFLKDTRMKILKNLCKIRKME
jgi:hypothetical protein